MTWLTTMMALKSQCVTTSLIMTQKRMTNLNTYTMGHGRYGGVFMRDQEVFEAKLSISRPFTTFSSCILVLGFFSR
jgi:hypothetical protein